MPVVVPSGPSDTSVATALLREEFVPTPLSSTTVKELPITDPKQTRRLLRQKRMINSFKCHGPVGLMDTIYQEARAEREKGTTNFTIDTLIADYESKEYHGIQLLYTLSEDVTISLIQNTLPHDCHRGPRIEHFAHYYMGTKDQPGVYMNQITSPHPEHEGKWLTTKQVRRLIAVYRAYIEDEPTAAAINNAIDDTFGDDRERRCYAKDETQREKGRLFCRILEAQYCRIDPDKLDEMHLRSPAEIGWSQNVARRVQQHARNGSSTYIFAFVNALSQLAVSLGGFGYGLPKAWCVFAVWKGCQRLARMAEITASILTGTYIKHGGYNPVHAGKFKLELDANDAAWDTAMLTVQNRLRFLRSPDIWHERNIDFAKDFFKMSANPGLAKELETLRGRLRRILGETDDAETSGDTGGAPPRTLPRATAELEAASERLRAKQQAYQEAFERYCQRLNQATPPGQAPFGDAVRRRHRLQQSYLRVEEKFNRTALLPFRDTDGPMLEYRPGPAAISQPLNEAEEAEVSRMRAELAASVDAKWEKFVEERRSRQSRQ